MSPNDSARDGAYQVVRDLETSARVLKRFIFAFEVGVGIKNDRVLDAGVPGRGL